jgi:hypothetical protein
MDNARLNTALGLVFANGRGESGLEVGADQGLSPGEHIQIPACLVKRWVANIEATAGAPSASDPEISSGDVFVHGGEIYQCKTDGTIGARLYNFRIDRPSIDDVRKFVAVNLTHIRDAELSDKQVKWVHSARFWAVVAGFVKTSKSREFVMVADPTTIPDSVNEIAEYIVTSSANSWTASAARATSWRKSNHATGGDIATGFPRRWLVKNEFWTTDRDKNKQDRENKNATSAFYVATHASSVHAVLALMASEDDDHWAKINPDCGLFPSWDVHESARVRMTPKTQVSGVAMVTDAVVTLTMLIKEGLAPLLEGYSQHAALATAYDSVKVNGIKVATYAGWFLDGHPNGNTRVQFNQKDASFAELIGELGLVATTYYRGSTIGESPALLNAAKQLGSTTAKGAWTALARAKTSISPLETLRVYSRIKGASASLTARQVLSLDDAERTTAITGYNSNLTTIATAFNVTSFPSVDKATVDANAASADEQAKAMAALIAPGDA